MSTPGGYFKTLALDQVQENLERLEKNSRKKIIGNDLRERIGEMSTVRSCKLKVVHFRFY